MRTLDFAVVGAAKAGTTAIHHYLDSHPEISLPMCKETNFFCNESLASFVNGPGDKLNFIIDNEKAFWNTFSKPNESVLNGEVCPSYLYFKEAPRRLYSHNKNMKIIIILRNPASRAFSHYCHMVRDNRETVTSFKEACSLSSNREAQKWQWSWQYQKVSEYSFQIQEYLRYFDISNIFLTTYEEFNHNNFTLIKDIHSFLKIKSILPSKKISINESGKPKNKRLSKLINVSNPAKNFLKSCLPVNMLRSIKSFTNRATLRSISMTQDEIDLFKPVIDFQVRELSMITGRTFSEWK